ncbi:MAG: oligosaccharide flippase family protein [Bosea sp.]|nr:oligosaccharide flippase family protein [Bosea sp. (in: a-proteobacteria)]
MIRRLASRVPAGALRSGKAAAVYFGTSALNAIVPLLLLPVLTARLTPADYGTVALFQAVSTLANVFIYFGMGSTVMRSMTVGPEHERRDYVASALVIIVAVFAATTFLGWGVDALAGPIAGLSVLWFTLAIATGGFMSLNQLYLIVLQARMQAVSFSFVQIGTAALNVGLTLLFVVSMNEGWQGRVSAIVLSFAVSGVAGILYMAVRREIGRPSVKHIKDAAQLGGATLPHSLLNMAMAVADRFLLNIFFSDSVVGVYAVGSQLASGIMFIGQSIHGAVQPQGLKMIAAAKTEAQRRRLGKIAVAIVGLILVMSIAYVVVVAVFAPSHIDPKFHDFKQYFFLLSIASIFQSIYFIFSYPLFYYRATKVLATTGFILAAVFAAVSLGGIYVFGSIGVSLGIVSARAGLLGVAVHYALKLTAIGPSPSVSSNAVAQTHG